MSVKAAPPLNEDYMDVKKEDKSLHLGDTTVQVPDSNNAVAINDKNEIPEIENDMIPEELLFALTAGDPIPRKGKNKLGPVKNIKTPERLQMAMKKGPPSNVWHHKSRRAQFQHLTDNPRSLGQGFGTRDISFLYDVAARQVPEPTDPSQRDKSAIRLEGQAGDVPKASNLRVPDTVIPEEYHLVKTKAVLGLEYIDDKLTTLVTDKQKALRVFPALQPTKRFEVVQLLKTLESMMEKSGVNDQSMEVKGPTQIHNLLELVKKEQNIYDLVFSEQCSLNKNASKTMAAHSLKVIRQVSIECIERGQLLSKLRGRYANLLNRIPRQIQSLHSEVMAQRSLDRRLTEELFRFKASISVLTNDLQTVREHDQQVTSDAEIAETELAKALQESQVNANLVDEYHDLYELQRKRMEANATSLSMERDLWSKAAYDLSLKVISINCLNTTKRLHVSEKAWSKLSNHFVVMLSDNDSDCLVNIQKHVKEWRETMFQFNQNLEAADRQTKDLLKSVRNGLELWINKFDENLISNDSDVRSMKLPSSEFVQGLCNFFKNFEEKLGEDSERFAGGQLLMNEEKLSLMKEEVEAWTEIAWEVYRRHKSETDEDFPLSSTLNELNIELHDLTKQLQIRINGENGVAKGVMSIQSAFDNWVNKLTLLVHSGDTMSENKWWSFYDRLMEYVTLINETIRCVGAHQRDEDRANNIPHIHISVEKVMSEVQSWMKQTVNQVEAEDGKLMAQVTSINKDLVLWMVQILLHLVPNYESSNDISPESSMLSSCTQQELVAKARNISEHMSRLTQYMWQCCSDLVHTTMQGRRDRGDDDPDHEYRDFLRVKREGWEWIRTCEFLLNSLLPDKTSVFSKAIVKRLHVTDDQRTSMEPVPCMEPFEDPKIAAVEEILAPSVVQPLETALPEEAGGGESSVAEVQEAQAEQAVANEERQNLTKARKEIEDEVKVKANMNLQILGHDENIQQATLEKTSRTKEDSLPAPTTSLLQSAYDAIANMEKVQKQLLETEIRAQTAEQRIIELEQELYSSEETARHLQKTVSKLGDQSSQSQAQDDEIPAPQPEIEDTTSTTDKNDRRKSGIDELKRSSTSRSSIKPKKYSVPKKK